MASSILGCSLLYFCARSEPGPAAFLPIQVSCPNYRKKTRKTRDGTKETPKKRDRTHKRPRRTNARQNQIQSTIRKFCVSDQILYGRIASRLSLSFSSRCSQPPESLFSITHPVQGSQKPRPRLRDGWNKRGVSSPFDGMGNSFVRQHDGQTGMYPPWVSILALTPAQITMIRRHRRTYYGPELFFASNDTAWPPSTPTAAVAAAAAVAVPGPAADSASMLEVPPIVAEDTSTPRRRPTATRPHPRQLTMPMPEKKNPGRSPSRRVWTNS